MWLFKKRKLNASIDREKEENETQYENCYPIFIQSLTTNWLSPPTEALLDKPHSVSYCQYTLFFWKPYVPYSVHKG